MYETDHASVVRFVEKHQHRRENGLTVKAVARGLGWSIARVMAAIDEGDGLQTTYYNVEDYDKVPDGERFAEYLLG